MGGQLGGAATAGNDVMHFALGIRVHGTLRAKAFHEAVVELLLPVPQQGMGANAGGSPEQPGFVAISVAKA